VIRQEQQQGVGELERIRKLHQQLVQNIQKLQKHRRALVGKVLCHLAMSTAVYCKEFTKE